MSAIRDRYLSFFTIDLTSFPQYALRHSSLMMTYQGVDHCRFNTIMITAKLQGTGKGLNWSLAVVLSGLLYWPASLSHETNWE